jgi:hypothetical protein
VRDDRVAGLALDLLAIEIRVAPHRRAGHAADRGHPVDRERPVQRARQRLEDARHDVLLRAGLGERLADRAVHLARVILRDAVADVAHEAVDLPAVADPDRRRRELDLQPAPVVVQRGDLEAAGRGGALGAREQALVRDAVALAPAVGDQHLVDALAHDLFLGVAEQRLGLRGPGDHTQVLVDGDVGVVRGLEHRAHQRGAVARGLERERVVERDRRGAGHPRQHVDVPERGV